MFLHELQIYDYTQLQNVLPVMCNTQTDNSQDSMVDKSITNTIQWLKDYLL